MPRCSRSVIGHRRLLSLRPAFGARVPLLRISRRRRHVAHCARARATSQRNRARLAVKPCRKLRPPTGPISPAQNAPASGDRPEQLVDQAGVVVGHAEEARPAPVAGEQRAPPRRARRRRASARRSSSAAAASRTWNWTVWPTSTRSPTASAPVSLVGAEHVADEEVAARPNSARCSSTTSRRAARAEQRRAPRRCRARASSSEPVERRAARRAPRRSCRSRLGHDERRRRSAGIPATRRCRRRRPSRNTPTAPCLDDGRRRATSRLPPGRAPADASAADHREVGAVVVEPAQEAVDRERERVGEQEQRRASSVASSGQPDDGAPSGVVLDRGGRRA